MALDLSSLTYFDLAYFLNGTFLGEVTNEARIRRQAASAGARIGVGKRVHFLRYAGWLFGQYLDWWKRTRQGLSRDERHGRDEAHRLRARRESIRNIGRIPVIDDYRTRGRPTFTPRSARIPAERIRHLHKDAPMDDFMKSLQGLSTADLSARALRSRCPNRKKAAKKPRAAGENGRRLRPASRNPTPMT